MKNVAPIHTEAWKKLEKHYLQMAERHMRDAFQTDKNRFSDLHISFENILLDFSKNRIERQTIDLLIELARACALPEAIESMFTGMPINRTENRAVLHTALRNFSNDPVLVDGVDVMPDVRRVREKMRLYSDAVRNGAINGYSGKPFRDIVHIGIGGSDLGPVMVYEALKCYTSDSIQVHFVSNVDATHLMETLKNVDAETTLFVIASKTFTTQETMLNAHTARSWFLEKVGGNEQYISRHFIALSTATDKVTAFGIAQDNMFEFWDWVGGRYSVWSAIGLSVCIALGYDRFEQFLRGAEAMDLHFRRSPPDKNIPVILALLGIWYVNFFGYQTQAVIPYDQYLHRLTAYLQQADMESNGKSFDRNGHPVEWQTGPVIWGEPGTNGQHAFFQLMHQGTQIIPADFILPVISLHETGIHQEALLSNGIAQTEALMRGKTEAEVIEELRTKGMPEAEIEIQKPYRIFAGNRPTNTILIDKITPYSLGSLIAMYEHKIFVQGVIWNIYSFDQWGVELGKKLATQVLQELQSKDERKDHDASTQALIEQVRKIREQITKR